MHVKIIAVVSLDGKLTRGNDPDIYKWTSKEDQEFFFGEVKKAKLIVMGSLTYEAAKKHIKHEKGKLRIVLTKSPNKYKKETIKNQLEFTKETPRQVYNRLDRSYSEILLLGGSKIYSSFLKESLVDEIYLTIEPVVFGQGKPLFAEGNFGGKLSLDFVRKLNKSGTVLLKYKARYGKNNN